MSSILTRSPRHGRRAFFISVGAAFSTILLVRDANAQQPYVSLPVSNILQASRSWCWAAAAQQVIVYATGNSPSQCELVARATGIPRCPDRLGHINEIRSLVAFYGGRPSALTPPAAPGALYQELAAGRPIVLHLNTGGGHFVVVRGMHFDPSAGWVVHVNDPMSRYTQPIPFSRLVGIWDAAIVVY